MIRKFLILTILAGSIMASCTKNFDTINVNPTAPSAVPLDYLFGEATLYFAGSAGDPGYTQWRANLIYSMPMIQQMASLGTFYSGDKYLFDLVNGASGAWYGYTDGSGNYANAVKTLVQIIANAKEDSVKNVNILNMARIVKVMVMASLTDIYGDVPYSEAGQGYLTTNFTPAFDPQSTIYLDMLNELSEAGAALDASAYIPSASDFSYSGDISKWKHLANSLMLRLAMRLTNVDAADAQKYAAQAISGGVFSDNTESYAINYVGGPNNNVNPIAYNLGASDVPKRSVILTTYNLQWSKTFIDALKTRNDPRLHEISTRYQPSDYSGTVMPLGDTVGADQIGLPNGLDVVPASGPTDVKEYSVPNILTYKSTSPLILVTYAEIEFLKAEAIERGWATGDAATEFAKGQEAAIQQMAAYDPSFVSSPTAISTYQANNQYPTTSMDAKMNAIFTEVWILTATTYNGIEGWSDWRRTGFPVLIPVNYVGNATSGTIPRRLVFPGEEATLDAKGYNQAISHMGADNFTTRVWWDGGTK
jgi:hypothetical protein